MKKAIFFVLCILISFSFTACSKNENESTNARVGTWKTAQTIQPYFYQDNIESANTVEVTAFTNPGDMKTALLADSLDLCGTTMVTAITAASKREPIVIVSGLSNKCSALVVGKNSKIINESDLKGKKIAYVPGTIHHLLLLEVLNRNGINPEKDVELVRIDFFDMGQALAQGTVDAFYSGEPYPSIAVAEGYGRILSYPKDDEFGIINSEMMTTREKIEKDPEMIQELVNAHIKATEYLNHDKNAWINKAAEFGTDEAVLEISLENIDLFWNINEKYIDSTKKLAQRMLEQGLIDKVPDIDAMFDLRFIEHVEKE
ncbi:MAG: ABC transporter substrate-binding protein [Anaerovorax sp.]|nr:ABC transporter substrate-binding protein [Anaerovorax sp.]